MATIGMVGVGKIGLPISDRSKAGKATHGIGNGDMKTL